VFGGSAVGRFSWTSAFAGLPDYDSRFDWNPPAIGRRRGRTTMAMAAGLPE
jgi:hypothetical protein